MAFFQSRSGRPINGSEENSFTSNLRHLPDNTVAIAVIKRFAIQDYQGDISYQIIWQLLDGDFQGSEVKQSIRPFEQDDFKSERALNMMFRVLTIGGSRTDFQDMPTNNDLAPMKGKVMSIKIGNGIIQGDERTWVREVWKEGEIETCTGETKSVSNSSAPTPVKNSQTPGQVDSALSRNAQRTAAPSMAEDDVPF